MSKLKQRMGQKSKTFYNTNEFVNHLI